MNDSTIADQLQWEQRIREQHERAGRACPCGNGEESPDEEA